MLTSVRSLTAASVFALSTALAAPAMAQDDDDGGIGVELSGNVAIVSDYRFRGVSFSDGDIALQGGIDAAIGGFYVGTWGSTISGGSAYGELELDVYAGYAGEAGAITYDVGLLYYIYPTGDVAGFDSDYFEPYASIGTTLGPVGATVGVAYAWEQDSLGGGDNFYIYTDLEAGIPDTPITLSAHLGYTDGVFATDLDGDSLDWGLGASFAVTDSLSLGVNYVDTEGPSIEDFTDAGFFFTIGYSM
ncbi:TorF family putative porin [Aurantiacibacter sp. MUD11]|uniref:TorF family putative porin n=1 Tax=Aurantiacibacter sp. MUD11 TaxID=3003265 RepID=UPI0022AA16D3|nr:TorF family putative porin [Aurantiacibacter sp. MUD11]WAT19159.1 TorF family putative porin [Aurantiacibacter sp. MUD11]